MAANPTQDDLPQQPSSQSYLKSSLNKLSPWARSPVVPPSKGKDGEPDASPLVHQKGTDHTVTHRHRLSLRKYPRDCPPLRIQWFHAVDVPKLRPNPAGEMKKENKPLAQPKKYAAFSKKDSKAIEQAYQKSIEQEDAEDRRNSRADEESQHRKDDAASSTKETNKDETLGDGFKVPVNEDYLFDVDVQKRELGPAYWLGPIYDVRRGSWFYQDSTVQRPCDENLSAQLEEGYLKTKAWRLTSAQTGPTRSASQSRVQRKSWAPDQAADPDIKSSASAPLTPKGSDPDLRKQAAASADASNEASQESPTVRLFGVHMNSVVTYQDGTTAWLLTDDFMSRMNYTVYQRFAGGGHFAGVKLTRGYIDPTVKKTDGKDVKDGKTVEQQKPVTTSPPSETTSNVSVAEGLKEEAHSSPYEKRRATLERQMSSLLETTSAADQAQKDEEMRKQDEREIEEDYRESESEEQGREISQLILVTHGIGQRLGLRLESVNFIHDVNTFRRTLKAVYADSPDLRALNAELDNSVKTNSKIQVLPICWRHLLDFPKQSVKHNRGEHDLADAGLGEDSSYPTLQEISVEGVPAVRNMITDLALDILLYQSDAYKHLITRIVLQECNRIYHLWMQRNPDFKGKVSLVGHSLGSAIMFDILCDQQDHGPGHAQTQQEHRAAKRNPHGHKLDFEVEHFYALGSPLGLFQMLKGRTIAARSKSGLDRKPSSGGEATFGSTWSPLTRSSANSAAFVDPPPDHNDVPTSRPKCSQLYNIFHPTDPISYRVEPLISTAMASLKPQPLPYTKRGLFGSGPVGQGLTGIGVKVGQSVSSLWTSMSSGLASSLLTRGLGYTGDDATHLAGESSDRAKVTGPLSMGAGTNVSAGVVTDTIAAAQSDAQARELKRATDVKQAQIASDALAAGAKGAQPPTLIDQNMETLYSGFEAQRRGSAADAANAGHNAAQIADEQAEAEERGKVLRREEAKVRALNANGRVDYAIQEGAFDINLIAAIASHLSYWSDEDLSHFICSQLLSRGQSNRERAGTDGKSG